MKGEKINYFDQRAKDWDTPENIVRNKAFAEGIISCLGDTADLSILDFGCGTGLLSANLFSNGPHLLGIDTSEQMLGQFRERFKGDNSARAICLNLQVEELPCALGTFDLIVSGMAFHHLQDPSFILNKLKKALAPKGHIVVIDLDKEDGHFHPDPNGMGVFHNGFNRTDMEQLAHKSGLKMTLHREVFCFFKHERNYPVMLSLFS